MDLEKAKRTAQEMGFTLDDNLILYQKGKEVGKICKVENSDQYALTANFPAAAKGEFSIEGILQSGVYVRVGSETRDLVYGTSDTYFFEWLNKQGFPAVNATPRMPLTTRARYNALREYEKTGKVLFKIPNMWSEFEVRIKSLEADNG